MKKSGSSERTVDDFIHNILNSSSLDNEMKASIQRMKAKNSQQGQFPDNKGSFNVHGAKMGSSVPGQGRHQPPYSHHHQQAGVGGGKQHHHPAEMGGIPLPAWMTNEASMPMVYRQIYESALRENGRLDTNTIYTIFLRSGLSCESLGVIWGQVNRTQPGQLIRMELNMALAIIAVIQKENRFPPLDYILRFKEAPVPLFSNNTSAAPTQQSTNQQLGTTSQSGFSSPSGEQAYSMTTATSSTATAFTPDAVVSSVTSQQVPSVTGGRALLPGEPNCPPPSYQEAVAIKQQQQLAMTTPSTVPVSASAEPDLFGDFESFHSSQPATALPSTSTPVVASSSSYNTVSSNTGGGNVKAPATTNSSSLDWQQAEVKPPQVSVETPVNQENWASGSSGWNQSTTPAPAPSVSKVTTTTTAAPDHEEDDWADFSSFQAPSVPQGVTQEAPKPLPTRPGATVIDLTIKKPPPAASGMISGVPAVPTTSSTNRVTMAATGGVGKLKGPPKSTVLSRPSQLSHVPADVELPPSEEKHESVDRYAALRDEFCGMSLSTTTSEETTDASSPSYDPAISTSSRSSTNNEFPAGSPDSPRFRNNSRLKQPPPAPVLPDPVPLPASIPASTDFDDFGEFQASAGPLPPLTSVATAPPPVATSAADKLRDIFDSLEVPPPAPTPPMAPIPQHQSTVVGQVGGEDSKPRSAIDFLANISSLAGDRYECVTETQLHSDRHESEWLRCLDQSEAMLEEARSILSGIVDTGLADDVFSSKQGSIYIDGLVQIFRVVCRIDQSVHTFSVLSNSLEKKVEVIKSLWKNLTFIVPQLEAKNESLTIQQPYHWDPVQLKATPETELCGVCLTQLSPASAAPVIRYGVRGYHCTCANFWVNCLDLTLPALGKPHLI